MASSIAHAGCAGRQACSRATRMQRRRRCAAHAHAAPGPQLRETWPVELKMDVQVSAPTLSASQAVGPPLHGYMCLPVDHYTLLPLPLGATLERVPGEGDLFALSIPRVRFFNLAVRPTITVQVSVGPADARQEEQCVLISVVRSRVDGDWADRLRLNELFEIWGTTRFTWPTGTCIDSVTDLRVGVDPPPPFSRLPTKLLVRVGNAVLNAVCFQLQRVFLHALAADYEVWQRDEAYRQRRAQGQLECAVPAEQVDMMARNDS